MVEKLGRQTWGFPAPPVILAGAAVCGPKEGQSALAADFDRVFPELSWGNHSFEYCEQEMQEKAARMALAKARLAPEQLDLFCAGDLINQITPSGFTARALGAPYFGLFSACATATEALALAALAVAAGAAHYALVVSGSHTCTAERQFRYPNEYGAQKPPYSQRTVTAAGAALVGQGSGPRISCVTIGRVRDEKVTDPFQMGAAMAPAFADTVATHLRERGVAPDYYDAIYSGDLGRDGCAIAGELLIRQGVDTASTRFGDCGLLLVGDDPSSFAGGSGCGCAAAVGFGHLLKKLQSGALRRILLCATGALLSPTANQQGESIPAICHAVAIEGGNIHV